MIDHVQLAIGYGFADGFAVLDDVQRVLDVLAHLALAVVAFLVGEKMRPVARAGDVPAAIGARVKLAIEHLLAEIVREKGLQKVMAGTGNGSPDQRLLLPRKRGRALTHTHTSTASGPLACTTCGNFDCRFVYGIPRTEANRASMPRQPSTRLQYFAINCRS